MKAHIVFITYLLCLYYSFELADSTLSPSDKGKKAKTQKEIKVNSGPIDRNVIERNLIEDEPAAKDIIIENAAYYRNTSSRLFDGPTLVYVTPVNIQLKGMSLRSMSDGELNRFSGTITATTWQKFSAQSSIWCRRFGCRCFVAGNICTNWAALTISMPIGSETYERLVRKIKNVKSISHSIRHTKLFF